MLRLPRPGREYEKADFRLDIEADAFIPHGKYEAAIVKGDPENSPLYQRLITEDKDDIMPPLDSHKELSTKEIELIEQWIREARMGRPLGFRKTGKACCAGNLLGNECSRCLYLRFNEGERTRAQP